MFLTGKLIREAKSRKMQTKAHLDTPALLVDIDKMRRNIKRMADFTRECSVNLRPHAKTHKVPEIAKMQVEAGAKGICVQKLSEAQVFGDHGFTDIFITNEVVGEQKLVKLAELADEIDLTIAVDNEENVADLSKACSKVGSELNIMVDIDIGMHRCGILPNEAATLAGIVSKQKNLIFKGLMGYEGHVGRGKTTKEREDLSRAAMDQMVFAKKEVRRAGLEIEVTSVGSSVSTWVNAKHPEVTEVQPGMYVFNAVNLVDAKVATFDDCALTVLSTVMSTPTENRVILDAGSKAFHFDQCRFPHLIGYDAEIDHFSEEHGYVTIKNKTGKVPRLGEKVEAIPFHCCTCVNEHDEMIAIRDGKVEKVWKIAGRGMMK